MHVGVNPENLATRWRAPLKKRWRRDEKTGKTIKLKDFRTFPIRCDEPLTRYVEE